MATHDTYRDQLLDLAYGELGRAEERELRAHLATCAACRAELEGMTSTRSTMAALGDEPAPERGLGTLLAAAREAAGERRPRPFLPSWLWGASVGAVAAAAVAILSVKLAGAPPAHLGAPAGEVDLVARAPAPEPPAAAAAPAEAGAEAKVARAEAPAPAPPATRERYAAPPPAAPAPAPARRERPALAAARPAAPPQPSRQAVDAAASAGSDAAPRDAEVKDELGRLALAERKGDEPRAAPAAEAQGASTGGGVGIPAPTSAAAPAPAGEARLEAGASRAKAASGVASALRNAQPAPGKRGSASTATFAGCPGEAAREVEVDDAGRVVRYLRRGVLNGTAFEAELAYGADGLLREVRYRAGGEERVWRPGGPVPGGVPPAVLSPRRAADAGLDAPPRCGE
jgi:hypothetical protein